jgi:hypothetical protein
LRRNSWYSKTLQLADFQRWELIEVRGGGRLVEDLLFGGLGLMVSNKVTLQKTLQAVKWLLKAA